MKLLGKLSTVLIMIVVGTGTLHLSNRGSEEGLSGSLTIACGSETDLKVAINKKLSSEDWVEADQARKILLKYSNESPVCRTKIIKMLIHSMNKRELNFVVDRRSYFLWLNGSTLLGELQAVDAIDLLIDHLDLNDGDFSASMVHQPAVRGIIAMGAASVPRLTVALQHNPNRNIRLAAALCLKDIGGPSATDALKQALTSESDQCIRRFIELSFEPPTDEVLQQRLLAFRCDN